MLWKTVIILTSLFTCDGTLGKTTKKALSAYKRPAVGMRAGVYVHPRHRAPGDLFINVWDTLDSHRLPCSHLQGVGYRIPLTGAYRQGTRNWRLTSNLYTAELTETPTLLILRQQTFSELLETTHSNGPGCSGVVNTGVNTQTTRACILLRALPFRLPCILECPNMRFQVIWQG